MSPKHLKARLLGAASLLFLGSAALAQTSPAPLPYSGGTVTQDFNTLAATNPNPNTNTALPPGFGFVEAGTGADATYVAGTGSDNQGNTYSFGATGSSERALGGVQSGSVVPTIGAILRNDSGATLTQFTVSYTGEQYRLGAARAAGVADRLDFQYSTTATTLGATTGFTDVDALDFTSPITTGTGGPVTASTPISATVTGVSIAPGATLVLRWNDFNVAGSDDGLAIDDFSFSTPGGTGPTPTPTPPPPPATGALISEYRWSGPGGAQDEFIELYNSSGAPLDLSGWSVVAAGAGAGTVTATIPANTPAVPVRGHLLLTGSAYSLADYGGVGQARGDVAYSGDIAPGSTLTLRSPSGGVADVVTGSGLPAPTENSQWSRVRRADTGSPRDTDVDRDDFHQVEANSTQAGASDTLDTSSGVLRLGAPGPENLLSPPRIGVTSGYVNPAQPDTGSDNRVRTGSGNGGTLSIRRTLTNNSGITYTRLRLRLAAGTMGTPVGPGAAGIADVRLMDGAGAFQVNGITVYPQKIETLPGQNEGSGGGLNASYVATLPEGGVAPGATVAVEILLRVVKSGTFRTLFSVEGDNAAVSSRPDDDNLLLGNPSGAMPLNAQASNKENLLVEHPALSLGYQKSAGGPKWVSWHLTDTDIGTSGRSDNFRADTSLPLDCQITSGDYTGGGYDRGHQCPSGDRTASDALNGDTFFMSNMLPQTAALNQRVWATLETYCRQQVDAGSELYIMSGGIGSQGTIAGGKVNVPASCWKVVVILPKGTNDLNRISTSTHVIAVVMPNTTTVSGTYSNYTTSVDNIENLTGLDLLSNLPDSIENVIEARQTN